MTSKQELHTFVKAAYALAITHKWLGSLNGPVVEATMVCREASKIYYTYCFEKTADKDKLCGEIMGLVQKVKSLLRVEPYLNSDPGSFIPDFYRASEERTVNFTPDDFDRVMAKFQQHHKSVCEASKASCHRHVTAGSVTSSGVCVTSFGTATELATTECATDFKVDKEPPSVQQIDASCPAESDYDSMVLGSSAASIAKQRGENKEKNSGAVNVYPPSQLTSPVKPGRECNKSNRPPLSRQGNLKTLPDQSSIDTEEEETDVRRRAFKGIKKENSSSSSLSSSFGSVSYWPKLPSLDSEMPNNYGHGHPVVQGKVIPSTNSKLYLSDQRARKSNTDSNMQTPPKTISDQSSIDTEDDLFFVNLPRSSSLSSSFGSQSSWQKVPSLPLGSSIDDSYVVVADNHIPANQVHSECQDSSPKFNSSWPRGKEGNKNNVIPASATNPKSVSDKSMETGEEPDLMNVNHTSVGPRGASQRNRKVSSSRSLSSLGSSFSWIKVPSLDTDSLNGDSGLTGRREGVPVSPNVERPSAKLNEVTKSPLSPVRYNTNGGPQKNSMDSAETGADILDPLPSTALTQDITKLKIANSSNSSQQSPGDVTCKKCFPLHPAEMGVLNDILTSRDYSALLAGVCHECLMDRLPKEIIRPVPANKAYGITQHII